MADTNEQAAAYIRALLEELHGARVKVAAHEVDEQANPDDKPALEDRVRDIEAELKRVGHKAAAPAKRAESRPAENARETR